MLLVLAESAIELVPPELSSHPAVVSHARRKGKDPKRVLLDRSYHHSAMTEWERHSGKSDSMQRRGRPDIIHVSLLQALDSPLSREGRLQCFVHTVGDHVITLSPEIRLPKNYNRFVSLLEQLFENGKVPPEGQALMSLRKMDFPALLDELRSTYTIGLSRRGRPTNIFQLTKRLAAEKKPAIVVGGFPRGTFSESVTRRVNELASIHEESLEAWTVVSRMIFAYEVSGNVDIFK